MSPHLLFQLGAVTTRYARAAGDTAARGRRAVGQSLRATPASARGVAVEAACVATHVALYPAAAVTRRRRRTDDRCPDRYTLADLPPLQRGLMIGDVTAASTPILMVHGFIDNHSIFARLEWSLRRRGFAGVHTTHVPLFATNVHAAAGRLADEVAAAVERSGHPHVHIVAHSLGGLVARYYVQRMGGSDTVHTLVTLATPHRGTRLAQLLPKVVPYPLVAQLRPGSELLRELDEPAPACRTRFIAYGGGLDNVVRPDEAEIHHPDLDTCNITIPGLGHHALPFSSVVAHSIAGRLGPTRQADTCPDPVAPPPPSPSSTLVVPDRTEQARRQDRWRGPGVASLSVNGTPSRRA